eukprot:2364975-Amphidinium_carterae.1
MILQDAVLTSIEPHKTMQAKVDGVDLLTQVASDVQSAPEVASDVHLVPNFLSDVVPPCWQPVPQ